MRACEASRDRWLGGLGAGLIHRRLYKATEATEVDGKRVGDFTSAVTSRLAALKYDPAYSFIPDSIADTPYKPYNPSSEEQATQIFVEAATGNGQTELSAYSGPVKELTKKYYLLRYFYPPELREDIDSIARKTLH
jgi:hypothetical protein